MEEALEQVDVDELSTEAVRAFFDLSEGGAQEAGTYNDAMLRSTSESTRQWRSHF
jgi:hypothetical protein